MQMSISLNNSTVLVLVKSTKLRANSNSKLELDVVGNSLFCLIMGPFKGGSACFCQIMAR